VRSRKIENEKAGRTHRPCRCEWVEVDGHSVVTDDELERITYSLPYWEE